MKTNPFIRNMILAFVFGLFLVQTASAEDAYLKLKKELQGGMKIRIDRKSNPTFRLEQGNESKSMNEKDSFEWISSILQSLKVKDDIVNYGEYQELIFIYVSSFYKECEKRDMLSNDMQAFCIRHLRSPDGGLRRRAFISLGFRKEQESIPNEAYQELLAFAKENPTYDANGIPHSNIMVRIAFCGRHQESLDWLKSIEGKYPKYELSRQVALLRMGEKQYEKDLIDQYYQTTGKEWDKKDNLAMALAYASTEETMKALASELRNNEANTKMGGFNHVVLFALTRTREWDLQLANYCEFNNEDFDKAEKWCEKRFNTKWKNPRPPIRLPEMRE